MTEPTQVQKDWMLFLWRISVATDAALQGAEILNGTAPVVKL